MNAVGPQARDPRSRQDEIEQYLDGVRAALIDLPEDVRNELLEDLPAHLADVASESLEPLVERLGEPAAYASELRGAAGLDAVPARSGAGPAADGTSPRYLRAALTEFRNALRPAQQALGRLVRPVDVKLGQMLGYERLADFLVLLIPGWWVLRGYIVGMFVISIFFGAPGLIPSVGGSHLIGLVFLLGCVVLSIRLGPVLRRLPAIARFAVRGVMTILALILVANVLSIDYRFGGGSDYVDSGPDPFGSFVDLYPYDSNGQPLTGVRLFDQRGNQIRVGDPYRCQVMAEARPGEVGPGDVPSYAYPLCPVPGSPRAIPSPSASVSASRPPTAPVAPGGSGAPTAPVAPGGSASPAAPAGSASRTVPAAPESPAVPGGSASSGAPAVPNG